MKSKTLGILAALTLSSHAITLTWSGPDGGAWDTTTTNWLDGVAPATWNSTTPDSATFGVTGVGAVNVGTGITAGGLTFGAAGYTVAGNTLTLGGTAPSVTTNEDATISATLAGSAGFTKAGAGILTLSGVNAGLAGGITISSGVLQLNAGSAAGTGDVTLGDANTGDAATHLTFGNSATGTGFTRNITVSSSGTGPATIKVADIGIALSGASTITLNRAATIDGSAVTNGYYQSARSFAGTGALTYAGASGKRFILSSSSAAFTGDVVVESGILEPRNTLNTATGSNMTVVSGAELRTDGGLTVNSLNGEGTVQAVNFGGSMLTVGQNGGSGSFAGTMRNNPQVLSLTKNGAGIQTLSGSGITFNGGAVLNNGTLALSKTTGWNSSVTLHNTNAVTLELNAPDSADSWSFAKQILGGSTAAKIEKTGSGTVLLSPAAGSSFAGSTTGALTVTGGKLYLNSVFTTTPVVSVGPNATFGGSGTAAVVTVGSGGTLDGGFNGSGTLTAGNVTLGSVATDTARLKGALSTTAGSRALSVADLTINGGNQSVTLDASGTGLTTGTYYDLLVSTNPITAPHATSVLASLKSNARAYTPAVDVTGKKIQLYYDANASVYWTGASGTAWNTSTTNWKLSGNNANTQFLANDVVNFNDSPANSTVDISGGDVSPNSTTFNNATTAYTLQGFNGIAAGSLAKNNAGILTILNANSYSGGTTINGGRVRVGDDSALGLGQILFTGGALSSDETNTRSLANAIILSANATFGDATDSGDLTLSGNISGPGALIKTGAGTLTLGSATSDFSGGTIISQGTLQLDTPAAAGTGPITLGNSNTGAADVQLTLGNAATDTGSTRDIGVSANGTGMATIKLPNIGTSQSGTGTIALNRATIIDGTAISGYYQARRALAGSGTLIFAGAPNQRYIRLTDSPSFTGDITLQSGVFEPRATLSATGGNNISVQSGAELRIQFSDTAINALTGDGLVHNTQPGIQTLTIGTGGGSGTFVGTIDSNLNLVKAGAGIQTLSGFNSYTGTTTVTGGSLVVDGSTGSGTVTVDPGASLAGTGGVEGVTTINGNIVPGGANIGIITINELAFGATGKAVCQINKAVNTLTNDQIYLNNGVTYGGTLEVTATGSALTAGDSFALFDAVNYSGTFTTLNLPPLSPGLGWDTSALNTNGRIQVVTAGGSYNTWASSKGLTAANNAKSADPDGDGVLNLMEFALGGNPLGATDNGISSAKIRDVEGTPTLTLTLAVRAGATFEAGPGNCRTTTVDGITYQIQGSFNLNGWTGTITEVTPVLTDALFAAPAGYEYHTFRTAGAVATTPKDFIRVMVTEAP